MWLSVDLCRFGVAWQLAFTTVNQSHTHTHAGTGTHGGHMHLKEGHFSSIHLDDGETKRMKERAEEAKGTDDIVK